MMSVLAANCSEGGWWLFVDPRGNGGVGRAPGEVWMVLLFGAWSALVLSERCLMGVWGGWGGGGS